MLRLTAITLAAMFAAGSFYGAETGAPGARANAETPDAITTAGKTVETSTILASFGFDFEPVLPKQAESDVITPREAIQIALRRGAEIQAAREAEAAGRDELIRISEFGATNAPVAISSDDRLWMVTASRVNLRAGPGTSHAVLDQVALNDRVKVLETGEEWVRIRLPETGKTAWIFGKFVAPVNG